MQGEGSNVTYKVLIAKVVGDLEGTLGGDKGGGKGKAEGGEGDKGMGFLMRGICGGRYEDGDR